MAESAFCVFSAGAFVVEFAWFGFVSSGCHFERFGTGFLVFGFLDWFGGCLTR